MNADDGLGGLFYAFLATLFFGSFAVPIKTRRVVQCRIDPVAFQCYKTAAVFATSLFVPLFLDNGDDDDDGGQSSGIRFTWWGVVGATVWVVNGTVAIMAVQRCGLSAAQAYWSGLSVFVGFLWGVFVFEEPVRDVIGSTFSLVVMATGMAAMAAVVAAAGGNEGKGENINVDNNNNNNEEEQKNNGSGSSRSSSSISPASLMMMDDIEMNNNNKNKNNAMEELAAARDGLMMMGGRGGTNSSGVGVGVGVGGNKTTTEYRRSFDDLSKSGKNRLFKGNGNFMGSKNDVKVGLLCATYVGVANGSFMTPLKYANKEVTGLEYLFSFGIGSAVATVGLVFLYDFYRKQVKRDFSPLNFHFNACVLPALSTGLLWSAGNACSIVAISRLGVAIGWPLVQCQLVVSTAWGMWYYREVQGRAAILGFSASTFLVLPGVVLLGVCSH